MLIKGRTKSFVALDSIGRSEGKANMSWFVSSAVGSAVCIVEAGPPDLAIAILHQ